PLKDTLEAELGGAMRAPSLETRENAQAEISRDWRASFKDWIDREGVNKGRPDSLCRHQSCTHLIDCFMGDLGRDFFLGSHRRGKQPTSCFSGGMVHRIDSSIAAGMVTRRAAVAFPGRHISGWGTRILVVRSISTGANTATDCPRTFS